jgi:uncharacterized iron-regulated protein
MWLSPAMRDHPLVGRIWDTRGGRFVEREEVVTHLNSARFALLGEIHDNADHHRLQRELIDAMVGAGRRPAIGMEQFDVGFQQRIDTALRGADATAESVAQAGGFDRAGWNWPLYEPLVATALRARLPVVALNLSRTDARRVATEGFDALGADALPRLGIEDVWSESKQAFLQRIIHEEHCGQLPQRLIPGMANAQRARDAVMADSLAARSEGGAVAILGRGHARRDLGVPIYLSKLSAAAKVVSVGIAEVETGRDDPASYAASDLPGFAGPLYDFVIFTPRAERRDPCESFKAPRPR